MKRPFFSSFRWLAAVGLGLGAGTYGAQAETGRPVPATNAPASARVLTVPKSVFQTNLVNGRDPFFPNSTRLARVSTTSTNLVKPPSILDQLLLKGVSTTKKRRLALINTITMAAGEKATFKLNDQVYTVQCLEIRDRSAVIHVVETNETKELFLRTEI